MALVHSKKATKTSTPYDLSELALVIQRGDEGVHNTASNKLSVIAEQIRHLQEEAKEVLDRANRDTELHHAACNMVKKPGSIYYLYERESGQKYLSIIAPEDWGTNGPKKFHGGFRLEKDRSWTPVDEIKYKDEKIQMLRKVMTSHQGSMRAAILGAPIGANN